MPDTLSHSPVECILHLRAAAPSSPPLSLQMQKRKYYSKLTLQGNVYPMPTMAYLQDEGRRFSVMSSQSSGAANLVKGEWEVGCGWRNESWFPECLGGGGGGGRDNSISRELDCWSGGPGFDIQCGCPLPTGWVGVSIMWLAGTEVMVSLRCLCVEESKIVRWQSRDTS